MTALRVAGWAAKLSLVAGIVVASYAVYIDHKASMDGSYVAMCEVSEQFSCMKVLSSPQSKVLSFFGIIPQGSLLDQSNATYGLIFFLLQAILFARYSSVDAVQVVLLWMSAAAMILCAYLAYVLDQVLQTVCLVCFATYVTSFLSFLSFAVLFGKEA